MSAIDDLLDSIFSGIEAPFYAEFETWVRASRRFRAFAAEHHSKIRAKLKYAPAGHGLYDVRAELETALLLLRDDRFTLEYEKYTASRQRGPDFTVTFRTHTPFNVEVRHVRGADADASTGKISAILCEKAAQMPPGIVNLLWLAGGYAAIGADAVSAAVSLRQSAERKDEEFFVRRGYKSAADFLRWWSQLSGIVTPAGSESGIWLNPLARHKTPPDIVTALRRLNSV